MGLEPTTLCLQSICSSLMSYNPILAEIGVSDTHTLSCTFGLAIQDLSLRFLISIAAFQVCSETPCLPLKSSTRLAREALLQEKPDSNWRPLHSKCSILSTELFPYFRGFPPLAYILLCVLYYDNLHIVLLSYQLSPHIL